MSLYTRKRFVGENLVQWVDLKQRLRAYRSTEEYHQRLRDAQDFYQAGVRDYKELRLKSAIRNLLTAKQRFQRCQGACHARQVVTRPGIADIQVSSDDRSALKNGADATDDHKFNVRLCQRCDDLFGEALHCVRPGGSYQSHRVPIGRAGGKMVPQATGVRPGQVHLAGQ